jgi:DNA gyrase subunit B/topoisomerase-4 subunit B
MMPKTLKETTLDPDRRRLLRVTIPETERFLTEKTITELMGKDAQARYAFIMEHAAEVEDLDV